MANGLTFPMFICHDVLQRSRTTKVQRNVLKGYSLNQLFMRNMKPFEGYPVILAVLGEGLRENSECLEYIKAHPEWMPQVHGYRHLRYDIFESKYVERDLSATKGLIEKIFDVEPTMYIPPYNQYSERTAEVAKSLGLVQYEVLRKPGHYKKVPYKCTQLDFHYWSPVNIRLTYFILNYHRVIPHFVIGAPRSGTTALMRFLADDDTAALKEKESLWSSNMDLRRYYSQVLCESDKNKILDKNVRNSLRIVELNEQFPDATFTHIIRDGRAAISSWRDWAVKMKKEDTSIEGAARQWVRYVTHILDNKHLLKNYKEVRYEELCFKHDYFKSRNGKWKKRLIKSELDTIMLIAGDLLRRLGYV